MAFRGLLLQTLTVLLNAWAISAIKCGVSFWTSDCLGDSDPRYDPDASINIKDQSQVYVNREGLYVSTEYNYGPDYDISPSYNLNGNPLFSYVYSPSILFTNLSYVGSRGYLHILAIMNHTNPGFPGIAVPSDHYATSTFEKDGSMITLPYLSLNFGTGGKTNRTSYQYPIGENTIFSLQYGKSLEDESDTIYYQSSTCVDINCENVIYSRQSVAVESGEVLAFAAGTSTRVTEDEWAAQINQAYDSANVPANLRFPAPMIDSCLNDCITEEDWCRAGDPSCNESPYQEPDGKLTTGAIVVIVIGSFLLVVLFVYVLVTTLLKRQEQRYRSQFAKRIAETIDLQKSMKSLTPSVLANEFNKIDEANDGKISKDELWNFLNAEGGDGDDHIRERDFKALWAALDTRGTGQVDFLEFCAFFSDCQEEYDEARRKNPTNRLSVRQSLAKSMTVKYEEVSKAMELSQAMEPVAEEKEES